LLVPFAVPALLLLAFDFAFFAIGSSAKELAREDWMYSVHLSTAG
jgi:hypothetical protein